MVEGLNNPEDNIECRGKGQLRSGSPRSERTVCNQRQQVNVGGPERFVTVTPSEDTGEMKKNPTHYHRHRFPPAIISHAVSLYYRFTLSLPDIEDLLAEPLQNANTHKKAEPAGEGSDRASTPSSDLQQGPFQHLIAPPRRRPPLDLFLFFDSPLEGLV